MTWVAFINQTASLITSLGIVAGVAIYAYQKLYGEKREMKRQDEARKQTKQLNETLSPLNISIKKLTEQLEESQRDRENLNKIADKNIKSINDMDERVDDHEIRITVLEDWRRGKKQTDKEGK